jgi:hypothetical protein
VKETCALCGFPINDDDDFAYYPGTGCICQDCLENPIREEGPANRPKAPDEMFGFEALIERGYD